MMRAMRGAGVLASALLGLAGVLFTASAQAAASVRLVYVRGPGATQCPPEPAIHSAVATRLGYDPFFPWANDSLFVEVTQTSGTYRVQIKLVDGTNLLVGERTLSVKSDDCSTVVDAMGLTVSLTIDPSSVIGPPSPPAPAAPPPPEVSAPAATSRAPDESAAQVRLAEAPAMLPTEAPVSLRAGVALLGDVGVEPAASAGAAFVLEAFMRPFSVGLEVRGDLPASAPSNVAPYDVQSWLAAGALVPCVHVRAVFGCGVVAIGDLEATSVGTASPKSAQDLWAAAGGRLGVDLPLVERWSLRVYGELLGSLRRDTLSIDGTLAYRYSPASGGAGVVALLHFR
jgi:hypothetical protein